MDVPVEATVHLNVFPNKTEVREILRSNGFVCTDLSSDRVRVKGSFLKLKTVAASLESLLKSQTKTDIAPYSSSPAPMVSSGAISKYYANNSSDGNRSWSGSRNKPLRAFPSSHPLSPEYRDSSSPRPDQHCSVRPGKESFVVDADVFMYADRLRKKDINCILDSHNVRMDVCQVGDGFNVTLRGKSASTAVGKIQSLLNDLNKSLRTQEVPLKDMNYEGKALLERIQKKKNIYDLVLIRAMNDTLHLIGPSGESYKLKQSLLGNPVDQSGRTGRTFNKNSRARSSSLPPVRRKDTETDGGAVAYPSPVGAVGYSPSKYQDDKQKGAVPERGAPGGSLRRSLSGSRGKTHAGRANGFKRELENKPPTPKSPLKSLQEFLKIEDLKKKLRPWR